MSQKSRLVQSHLVKKKAAPPQASSAPPLESEGTPSTEVAAVPSPSPSLMASTQVSPSVALVPSVGQPSTSGSPSVKNQTKVNPQPPHLDLVQTGPSGGAIVASTPTPAAEAPRSIRFMNKDGKAPTKKRTIRSIKT